MSDTPKGTVSKSFRLTNEDVERLRGLSEALGCSQTDAIRRALQMAEDAIRGDTERDTASEGAEGADALTRDVVAALVAQLAARDAQISEAQAATRSALDVAAAAQETARAAQVLHARQVAALEDSETKARRWRWPWRRGD